MSINGRWEEQLKGTAITIATFAAVSAAMFSLRSHLSVATSALVLVIPVIWGVVIGGFVVGLIGILLGFLIYDFVFIPPYYTLNVGQSQNWIALGVYVVVVILVSRVVANLKDARFLALEREKHARQLFELSKLLLGEKELGELLQTVTSSVQTTFQFDSVVLLLQGPEKLEVGATAGVLPTPDKIRHLIPETGSPATVLSALENSSESLFSLALTVGGKPVGLLVMLGTGHAYQDRQLLSTFANNAALAIEQAQLKEQALQAHLLEETDRWRRALLGSASHDLRTPLASIKAAASSLSDHSDSLTPSQERELLETISLQTDRLSRLVANLLDMSRIEAGVLTPRKTIIEISEIIQEGIDALGDENAKANVRVDSIPEDLYVLADHVLISQVVVNLLENALRHSPNGEPVIVGASSSKSHVSLTVSDSGPGVPSEMRERVFEMFNRDSGEGHAGLGLAIAKAFITAHGGQISVEAAPSGGARFAFTLPLVMLDEFGYINDQDTLS